MSKSKKNSDKKNEKRSNHAHQVDHTNVMEHIKSIHSKESATLPGLGTGED